MTDKYLHHASGGEDSQHDIEERKPGDFAIAQSGRQSFVRVDVKMEPFGLGDFDNWLVIGGRWG